MTAIPALVLVVSPSHTSEINSVKDLAGKRRSARQRAGLLDRFLLEVSVEEERPRSHEARAVIGVGLGATAVAAMGAGAKIERRR